MNSKAWMVVIAGVFGSGAAQAALLDRGGGLIYDTDLNITWLQDANYAKTSGYDANGRMTWAEATAWAANLSYGGYDDWRLPSAKPINGSTFGYNFANDGSTDVGYNISEQGTAYAGSTQNEMAHLFYNSLDNKGRYDTSGALQPRSGLSNTGPFSNIQSFYYWSGTEYAEYAPYNYRAWNFLFEDYGFQDATDKSYDNYFAWAVRPGDVAAVPEVQTYALMLAGLGLIGWRARQRG